jgi:hypothetical protein
LPRADAAPAPAAIGITVATATLDRAEAILKENGVAHARQGARIQVGPHETCGIVLTFVPA